MTTPVINIKDAPKGWQNDPQYVYIGRQDRYRKLNGYFGNPFPIGTDSTREEVVKKFRTHALGKIAFDPEYARRVKELHGKTLVCFCAPFACHGDVLAELAERLNSEVAI
jgi:hypothetical protein